MDTNKHCPICFEVPEKEVYQCLEGHVICHLCLPKVPRNKCPNCRASYGAKKIRNRYMEEQLDSQEFPCKFKDKGCTQICKREEITSHGNKCLHNPVWISQCEQIGFNNCKFRCQLASRSEVILHFLDVHNMRFINDNHVVLEGSCVMEIFSRKRKLEEPNALNYLGCISNNEMSPVILIHGKMNRSTGYFTFVAIEVWQPPSNPAFADTYASWHVFFSLDIFHPDPTIEQSSQSFEKKCTRGQFPIEWTVELCNIDELHHVLKVSPVNISISLLEKSQFGSHNEDCLRVWMKRRISLTTSTTPSTSNGMSTPNTPSISDGPSTSNVMPAPNEPLTLLATIAPSASNGLTIEETEEILAEMK